MTSLGDLPRLRHFYGREQELDNIVNLLEARATTLLVPGIASCTLARHHPMVAPDGPLLSAAEGMRMPTLAAASVGLALARQADPPVP